MNNAMPYIIKSSSITIIDDGTPITISKSDPYFDRIVEAIREKHWELVSELANKPKAVELFGKGHLVVTDGEVLYKGEAVHNHVVNRIFDFITAGLDADPLINFLNKLLENPSKRCVDELFNFLEHGNMPLDPDGDFYAYKAVRSDWMDKHSGTIRNQIGDVVEMPRNQVDDNSGQACSAGLHAGSIEYVNGFGDGDDKFILVKINPADVVSVPHHDDRKLRCCRYLVTGLYTGPLPETVWEEPADNDDDDDHEYCDDPDCWCHD